MPLRPGAGVKAFAADDRGSMGVMAAVCVVALCGIIGLGLDVSVWYMNGRQIQAMAEVTALSAGRLLADSSQTQSTVATAANNNALLNGLTSTTDTIAVSFGPALPPSATSITVAITRKVPLIFTSLFLPSQPIVATSATAAVGTPLVCIYVLDSAPQSLLVNTGFNLNAPNCEIDVASRSTPAAIFDPGSTLTVKKTCIGGTIINNGATVGGLSTNCSTRPNPYKGTIPAPTIGGCTVNGANYAGTVNLTPGTYCGTFNFNGSGTMNLAPGTYVFNGTHWNINNGWSVNGTGVTLFFADSSSYIQFNSGVSVSLTAPTSGTYANVLMFEPDGLSSSGFAIDGTSSSGHALQGLVYLPSRNITLNSTYSGVADAFTLVVNQLIFDGNSPNTWSVNPSASNSSNVVLIN